MAWRTSLAPSVPVDATTTIDGQSCRAATTTACPIFGPPGFVEVSLEVSDGTGRTSTDTENVLCYNPLTPIW